MTKRNVPPFRCARWAQSVSETIVPYVGKYPIPMAHSDGTGLALIKEGAFGADVIRFGPGEGVGNHTHAGAHILFCIKGSGFVEYDGVDHPLDVGVVYLVPGGVDHAIKATTELVLIAVGNEHQDLASKERINVTE